MTYFWICVSAWLSLNATVVISLIAKYRAEQRFNRHANSAIDLTGGTR